MLKKILSITFIAFMLLGSLRTARAQSTSTPSATPSAGGALGVQYQPQVSFQYGANNTFGGLSFKGVGAALVSCTGFGDVVAGAVTSILTNAKGYVADIVSVIPYVGTAISGLIKGTPGSKPTDPTYVSDQPLERKAACLDGIAYVLSQQVLQQITNRTLHWANTGFNGNPLYVKNIDSYLLSIRNETLTHYLQGAQASDPIFGNALRSIITQQVTGRSDGLLNTALTTPQAQAYNSFISDFTNGGWGALLNPANNPIGAFFNATDNINQKTASSQQNIQNELQQGNGFLNMKTCVQYSTPPAAASSSTVAAIASGLSSTPTCLKYENVTPGSIIAQQVSTITNSPTRQAELATHFNEAVGSFFDAMLNQLFSRGLSGLKGTANPADLGLSFGGNGSNTVTDIHGQPLPGVNDSQLSLNQIAAAQGGTVDISRPQLLRAILQTQYDYINRASDSRAVLDRLVPEFGQLDYCFPGPNPSWQDSLGGNFTAYTAKTIASSDGTNSTLTNNGLSLYDKFSTAPQPIGNRNLSVLNNTDAKGYVQGVYAALTQYITNKFSRTGVGNAYATTAVGTANQDYARGMATDIYDEVSALPTFAKNAVVADTAYGGKIAITQSDIHQLNAINNQVLKIVSAAKARYEQQQKTAGTPVNQQCLDAAYATNMNPVIGVARQESSIQSPVIQQSLDANKYFYSNL